MASGRQLAARLRDLEAQGGLQLPDPGDGRTAERHRALFEFAREDVSLARLVEAHTDALSILHEAGRDAAPGALYGVWAAEDPSARLEIVGGPGNEMLIGTKAFCTGAGIVDRALVSVPTKAGVRLVDVGVAADADVEHQLGDWVTTAFASTQTGRVRWSGCDVSDRIVGEPGWYLDRPGFWHGACGPAACWAGGAAGLVDALSSALATRPADPHRDAHLGAVDALRWRMEACLQVAGDEIDADPLDATAAHRRALALRHGVERDCVEIVDRFGRALGPRARAFDRALSRRMSEVELYVRQCHAERDLAALGEVVRRTATEHRRQR